MPPAFTLSSRSQVVLEEFPYKWVPMLNFFDSDVPGFPLQRIHVNSDGTRLFGVPVSRSVDSINGDGTCTLNIDVITNRDLDLVDPDLRDAFSDELEERLGFSEALSIDAVKNCCQNPDGTRDDRHHTWEKMVDIIFPRLQYYFGDRLRCGQFYSRTYGLFRLVSTWNVPGGEKQEIIMTSNLLKTVGRDIENERGEPINLYLLPTYEEILEDELDDFPKFRKLKEAVEDFGDQYLTRSYPVGDSTVYLLDPDTYVPTNAEKWDNVMETVDKENRELLVQLKEDMNRMYQRPFVLILYLYNAFQGLNFSDFSREEYAQIYRDSPRTMYPKVLGMILQQAFGNYECIPVDTWVETFFVTILDTPANEIPESGSELGKFERFVWETAQLRKTNQPLFDEIVHCIKTGIMHSKSMHMREPNPLSCNLCALSSEGCPTYRGISDRSVTTIERDRLTNTEGHNRIKLSTPAKNIDNPDRELYIDEDHFGSAGLSNIDFIVVTDGGQAVASFSPTRGDHRRWKMTDDMSPFTTHIPLEEGIASVSDIVEI